MCNQSWLAVMDWLATRFGFDAEQKLRFARIYGEKFGFKPIYPGRE